MSKETEPIRSRRQLREHLAQSAGVVGNPPAPVRPAAAKPPAGSSDSAKPRSTPDGPSPTTPTPTAKQTPRDAAVAEANYAPLPGLIPGGDYYPVSAGPPSAATTSSPGKLPVLATEHAEVERTAILAERTQAHDRLAQESAKNRRPAADPTAIHNLAMVTPLEFIEVEGAERPVLRPPSTTHVPIITQSTPRQSPATGIPLRPEFKLESGAAANEAQAAAPADYAHGLEPLDAVTAGLGRARRNKVLRWGAMIVGGAALVVFINRILVNP